MVEETRHVIKSLEECIQRLNKSEEQQSTMTILLTEVSRRLSMIEDKLESVNHSRSGMSDESGINSTIQSERIP